MPADPSPWCGSLRHRNCFDRPPGTRAPGYRYICGLCEKSGAGITPPPGRQGQPLQQQLSPSDLPLSDLPLSDLPPSAIIAALEGRMTSEAFLSGGLVRMFCRRMSESEVPAVLRAWGEMRVEVGGVRRSLHAAMADQPTGEGREALWAAWLASPVSARFIRAYQAFLDGALFQLRQASASGLQIVAFFVLWDLSDSSAGMLEFWWTKWPEMRSLLLPRLRLACQSLSRLLDSLCHQGADPTGQVPTSGDIPSAAAWEPHSGALLQAVVSTVIHISVASGFLPTGDGAGSLDPDTTAAPGPSSPEQAQVVEMAQVIIRFLKAVFKFESFIRTNVEMAQVVVQPQLLNVVVSALAWARAHPGVSETLGCPGMTTTGVPTGTTTAPSKTVGETLAVIVNAAMRTMNNCFCQLLPDGFLLSPKLQSAMHGWFDMCLPLVLEEGIGQHIHWGEEQVDPILTGGRSRSILSSLGSTGPLPTSRRCGSCPETLPRALRAGWTVPGSSSAPWMLQSGHFCGSRRSWRAAEGH